MKILFLDIDGVISRFRTDYGNPKAMLDEPCIRELVRICEATGCKIVISSTWKVAASLMRVLEEELFPRLPEGCVIGCTPTLPLQPFREEEIDAWFAMNPGFAERYAIIDDYDFELKTYLPKGVCVITDANEGLTRADADKAIAILNGTAQAAQNQTETTATNGTEHD